MTTIKVEPGRRAPAIDELEEALEAPAAHRGEPFVHIFTPPLWRLLFSRIKIRVGDVALCGFVSKRSVPGVPVYRKIVRPLCPRCEQLNARRWL